MRIHLVTVACLSVFYALSAQGIAPVAGVTNVEKAYRYHLLDPKVVYRGDEEGLITLKVATTGVNILQVRLFYPDTTQLYDDGTHGDLLAADGIYTRDKIQNPSRGKPLRYGGTHTQWGIFEVRIDRTDGTTESHWLNMGIVHEGQIFKTVKLGDGLYATDYAFFIVDPAGEVLDAPNWPLGDIHCGDGNYAAFEKLYGVLPDVFDFVVIMPAHDIFDPARNYGQNVPYFKHVKNTIQNIGMPASDNSAAFHSKGRLTGMIYHSWDTGQILDHEFGHAWSAHLGQSLGLCYVTGSYGDHWSPYSDIGGQMNAFLSHPAVTSGAGHLKNNGDGSWSIIRDPGDSTLYSKLDLYAMGLIPSSEVPPVHVLVNPNITDEKHVTADTVNTFTMAEIMAATGGERIPGVKTSPKEFTMAFIVVKNKNFTPAEYAYYSLVAKYFTSKEQGEFSLTTFYTATGGRATLNAKLPVNTRVESTTHPVADFSLRQNYPNPFNQKTRIEYTLQAEATVDISLYNCRGELVRQLVHERQMAGSQNAFWDGKDSGNAVMPSGVYYARVQAGERYKISKLLLIR